MLSCRRYPHHRNLAALWRRHLLRAFHQHNEHRALTGVVQQLEGGVTLALCSDAGTPGISDPGFLLVRACVEAGIDVECLPGATAFVPALADLWPAVRPVFVRGIPAPQKGPPKATDCVARGALHRRAVRAPTAWPNCLPSLKTSARAAVLWPCPRNLQAARGNVSTVDELVFLKPPLGASTVVLGRPIKRSRGALPTRVSQAPVNPLGALGCEPWPDTNIRSIPNRAASIMRCSNRTGRISRSSPLRLRSRSGCPKAR